MNMLIQNKNRKRRLWFSILVGGTIIIASIIVGAFFLHKSSDEATVYANKDYVYCPDEKHLSFDEKTATVYFDNQLVAYTFETLSDKETKKLANEVKGEVVGKVSGMINAVQVRVKEADLNILKQKAEVLMESEDVLFAGYDYPIAFDNLAEDGNPWSKNENRSDKDRGNEAAPGGNDWWAEAIGAYTAWNHSNDSQAITVGILDNGFDFQHKDLKNNMYHLEEYPENREEYDHGTHVAGIIGAENNEIGIRGVADQAKLICVDWSPAKKRNYLSTLEYIEITKQLIEQGAKVINNSWGNTLASLEKYTDEVYADDFFMKYFVKKEKKLGAIASTNAYEYYIKYNETVAKRTALECTIMISSLLFNNKDNEDDFLIVQSAGNGYDKAGPGYDAKYTGYYCGINEDVYDILSEKKREEMKKRGVKYEDIDERVIIVGAAKNERNNGKYLMRDSSNYGSNIDICAPGENIFSTLHKNTYGELSGTSMAAPMVSGSAALLWSLDPTLTAPEVKDILRNETATEACGVGKNWNSKYPMLNIGTAVQEINQNVISEAELLNEYWVSNVQSLKCYKFLENGTVEEYSLDPGREIKKENMYFSQEMSYSFQNNHLTIDWGNGNQVNLKAVTKDMPIDWDPGLSSQIASIPDGRLFFYETDWVEKHPADNAVYLVKASDFEDPVILEDNSYDYDEEIYYAEDNVLSTNELIGKWEVLEEINLYSLEFLSDGTLILEGADIATFDDSVTEISSYWIEDGLLYIVDPDSDEAIASTYVLTDDRYLEIMNEYKTYSLRRVY